MLTFQFSSKENGNIVKIAVCDVQPAGRLILSSVGRLYVDTFLQQIILK